jgi:hypothetical protein
VSIKYLLKKNSRKYIFVKKKNLDILVAEGSNNVGQDYSKIYNSSRVFKPEPHDKGLKRKT